MDGQVAEIQEKFAGLISKEDAARLAANGVVATLTPGKTATAEKQNQPASPPVVSLSQLAGAEGSPVTTVARVWHVFSPKSFRKEERTGRVCNVLLRDATGEARLALWGADVGMVETGVIRRNTLLELKGATVKSGVMGVELHAGMTTRITTLPEDGGNALPRNEHARRIAGLSTEDDVDVELRVLETGKTSEFVRVSKTGAREKGVVRDAVVGDGTATARLVAWDYNAGVLEKASAGDGLLVQGAYVKKTDSGTEVHVGWKGCIASLPSVAVPPASELLAALYPRKTLSELADGDRALVTARFTDLAGAAVSRKCLDCGAKAAQGGKCGACGSGRVRELLVLRTVLDDRTMSLRCVFFGETALKVLGMEEMTIDPATALELKKDYVVGREAALVVNAKKNDFGEIECIGREIIKETG